MRRQPVLQLLKRLKAFYDIIFLYHTEYFKELCHFMMFSDWNTIQDNQFTIIAGLILEFKWSVRCVEKGYLDMILQNWWEFKQQSQSVSTAYSVAHPFLVYYTFYHFLFPLGDFEFPGNSREINQRIFSFFDNLQRYHQRKIRGDKFTKLLIKSVHHGWTRKRVMIFRT